MIILKVVLWLIAAAVAGVLFFLIGSKNKLIRFGLQVVLLVSIGFLAYSLYDGIMEPIRFNEKKDDRYRAAVKELIYIKTAQEAYKKEFGKFAGSYDSLIYFVKNDSITEIIKEGEVSDSILKVAKNDWKLAEQIALKEKLIIRDTLRVSTKDSLFKDYNIENLGIVPYTNKKERFELDTATVESSGIKFHVFQAQVHNNILLFGLNNQLILNLNDEVEQYNMQEEQKGSSRRKYAGLRVGSIEENNNNQGNWSKEYE